MDMMKWLQRKGRLQKLILRFDTVFFKVCNVSIFEVIDIIRIKMDRESRTKWVLFIIGTFTSAITLAGMFLGFMRAYYRYDLPQGKPPTLSPLSPHTRAGLVIGAIMIWLFVGTGLFILYAVLGRTRNIGDWSWEIYLVVNTGLMALSLLFFNAKRYRLARELAESVKHGSARLGNIHDVQEYLNQPKGIYFGGDMLFNEKGHLLTIAGTRGGKGTNLIIPNMLGIGNFDGSWVVVDPKGEAAAVCARYQQAMGKQVYVLNPWDLLAGLVPPSQSYNPLDLLVDKDSPHLIDDAQVIAEMIVPIVLEEKDKFFSDMARSIIAGMIAYIAFTQDEDKRNLHTLYKNLRLNPEEWKRLVANMKACWIDGGNGDIISIVAEEIQKMMKAGEKTWGNILISMLQSTDFIKSPPLQASFKSGFNPACLRDGNTVVYVVIPADKMSSHARWLRLVVMTMLRSIVRNPVKDKQVCFLLDEFSALGYLSEIETALGTYAGYGITIWPVLQSMTQLQGMYEMSWENFIANATVRTFFSVNDNFSAKYLSEAIGVKTNVFAKAKQKANDPDDNETTARALLTPDEIRRTSGKHIIAFVGDKPPLLYPKVPYYEMKRFHPDGKAVYDVNPYI